MKEGSLIQAIGRAVVEHIQAISRNFELCLHSANHLNYRVHQLIHDVFQLKRYSHDLQ
jgi:hypothetical protein